MRDSPLVSKQYAGKCAIADFFSSGKQGEMKDYRRTNYELELMDAVYFEKRLGIPVAVGRKGSGV